MAVFAWNEFGKLYFISASRADYGQKRSQTAQIILFD